MAYTSYPANPGASWDGVAAVLVASGVPANVLLPPNGMVLMSAKSSPQVVLPSSVTMTFGLQTALDAYFKSFGFVAVYPMAVTAPATAAVGSAVTVTADTGDATYTGPVEFYVGGALQATATASAGRASCGITSSSSGTVTVYAWVPQYGYDSAQVSFQ